MTVHIKVPKPGQGGPTHHWVQAAEVYAKTNGTWHDCCEAYYKENGAWHLVFNCTQKLTIPSSENLNLGNWLRNQNVPAGIIVEACLPSGNTIGGTVNGGSALTIGDISDYKSVKLIVQGNISGKGGTVGYKNGSHAIRGTSPITIDIDGGWIRGGGGAGGDGGDGGKGDWVQWWRTDTTMADPPHQDWMRWRHHHEDFRKSYWQPVTGGSGGNYPDDAFTRWINHDVGFPGQYEYVRELYALTGYKSPEQQVNVVYKRGAYQHRADGRDRYEITRNNYSVGQAGAGGDGGLGRGYNQTNTAGDAGEQGYFSGGRVHPSEGPGNGGNGGLGGNWGLSGGKGGAGGNGRYFHVHGQMHDGQELCSRRTSSGGAGKNGGTGGRAINNPGAILTGDTGNTRGAIIT
jgi:hypothetical protein